MSASENIYEQDKLVQQYLLFHYGKPNELFEWSSVIDGITSSNSLNFPVQTAELAIKHFKLPKDNAPTRVLDIGCAVGRSSFELSVKFDQVLGIDYSQKFIDAALKLKQHSQIKYDFQVEGDIRQKTIAHVPEYAKKDRVQFEHGDACNLPLKDLGQFDCVHAANLICRLPTPKKFLTDVKQILKKDGILVITSPYSWFETFTPKVG
ncbi:unnamed protein product [Didymodactylos carnosus]|uniref:Methyltransferase type 11 domain-containing protein n=1 Tax=Didymodactylos carnosus TaxID=1234261 RepID=A0A815T4B2_9BILA|nr:unnamed protein product [Didymodactylos carnosus]CAF4358694.1 unnamed protein product [Didymodactylos carnosus]